MLLSGLEDPFREIHAMGVFFNSQQQLGLEMLSQVR
jgi:hypothetical protein